MNTAATLAAIISVVALGAFWPTLKVHFNEGFAKRFAIPAFLIAVANCFVLSQSIGWWTILTYPVLAMVGAGIVGQLTSGRHLQTIVFDGGIWIV